MTTKEVIKLLQIDEKVKMQILRMYDYMDDEQKLAVQRVAWNTYFAMFNQQLDKQLDTQFQEVIDGKEHFGDTYYEEAVTKTEKKMAHERQEAVTKTDLTAARQAMQQIVSEINSSKTTKKGK